jgi:hypothetical protein
METAGVLAASTMIIIIKEFEQSYELERESLLTEVLELDDFLSVRSPAWSRFL